MLKLLLYCLKRIGSSFKDTKKLFLKTKIWKIIILPNWKDDFFNLGVFVDTKDSNTKKIFLLFTTKI